MGSLGSWLAKQQQTDKLDTFRVMLRLAFCPVFCLRSAFSLRSPALRADLRFDVAIAFECSKRNL